MTAIVQKNVVKYQTPLKKKGKRMAEKSLNAEKLF